MPKTIRLAKVAKIQQIWSHWFSTVMIVPAIIVHFMKRAFVIENTIEAV